MGRRLYCFLVGCDPVRSPQSYNQDQQARDAGVYLGSGPPYDWACVRCGRVSLDRTAYIAEMSARKTAEKVALERISAVQRGETIPEWTGGDGKLSVVGDVDKGGISSLPPRGFFARAKAWWFLGETPEKARDWSGWGR